MKDEQHRFSALTSLIRLISLIGVEGKVDDLCMAILTDTSQEFGIKRLTCCSLEKGTATLRISGSSERVTAYKSIKLDDSSVAWLAQLPTDKMHIIESIDHLPQSFREILAPDEQECVALFIGRDDEPWHLVAISIDKENAQAVCNDAELAEYFRGVLIILDTLDRIGENLLSRLDINSVFELAPIGIIICDEDGSVISANNQALLILGCGPDTDALIGGNLVSGDAFKNSGLDTVIKRAIAGEQVDIENLRFRCPSGKSVYLDVRFRSTRSKNGRSRVIGILADVTQRIRLQQQLERSYRSLTEAYEELQRIDKMKTRFIDTVSHELRTPLTVMRGYLEMLESGYSDKIDQKVMGKIKAIRANTERLYDLVETMLDVARIEQGAMEIIKQEASIKNLIEEVVASQQGLAHDKHQEITLVLQGELSSAMFDYRKMKDALRNVLNNAIRYTPEGGKIQVGAADEGKMIHIWVKDNGIGIPTSELERIFDRFHIVVAKELSHQVDRMGLGLPMAKGIVDAHGGKIWVESEVGKGSIFHIHIPKQ